MCLNQPVQLFIWRGETVYSMKVYLFDRLSQLSALRLRFKRVDTAVGHQCFHNSLTGPHMSSYEHV
jgi:hypothetical protein